MKTIGVIGGFGPEATAQFYLKLVSSGRKILNGKRPNIIIRNVSVPKKLERDALKFGKDVDQFLPFLIEAAKELEQIGVDIIVLPCNTLHVHEDAICAAISIPFVSIVASTAQFLNEQKITHVGLLGSRITIRENLFKKRAENITFMTIGTKLQRQTDRGLDMFISNQNSVLLQEVLMTSCVEFRQRNVKDVILACTDFGTLCPNIPNIRIHDTLDILVGATINML